MSLNKDFVASIIDKDGFVWLYEGMVGDNPIWVLEHEAKPLLMTESEALEVAQEFALDDEIAMAKKVH